MTKHDTLARVLAITGTVLVALPLVLPFVFSLRSIGGPGGYRLDYLMPFEAYPVTLVGVALLAWAAFRAHERRGAVGWLVVVMIGGIVLAGVSAQLTGIAQSTEQLEAWRYAVTAALAATSLAAQVALIVVGWLLIRDLFGGGHEAMQPPPAQPI